MNWKKFYVFKYNSSKGSKFECDRVSAESYLILFTILKDRL